MINQEKNSLPSTYFSKSSNAPDEKVAMECV